PHSEDRSGNAAHAEFRTQVAERDQGSARRHGAASRHGSAELAAGQYRRAGQTLRGSILKAAGFRPVSLGRYSRTDYAPSQFRPEAEPDGRTPQSAVRQYGGGAHQA